MKKPRHLLLVLTSLVLACTLLFAVACKGGCKSCKSCADAELESIELNLDDVKTDFYTGGLFTAGGLKITANFTKGKPDDTITNQTEGVVVDSSAFNQDKIGTYEIKVSYTLNEKTAEATYNVNVSDVSISVDQSGAQRLFVVNEDDFNSDGLKVFRTVKSPTGATTTQLASSDYTVSKAKFDKTKVGTYDITVTYQIDQKYVDAAYEVQVIERRQGLQVSFKDGMAEKETITLQGTTDEVATADLSEFASWIEARKPDKYGVVAANAELIDLEAENVTVDLYEGMYPVEDADIESLEGGAYTIKVTLHGKDNADKDFDYIGFVNVYVVDDLKSLEWNENAAGTRTQQTAGKEVMSKTWQFTATYESGKTETVLGTDQNVKITGLAATTATDEEGATATVSFTAINSKRVSATKSAEVTYKIDPLTGIQNYELMYKVSGGAWVSEWKNDFEGAASQVSVVGTTTTFKSSSKSTTDGTVSLSEYTELKKYQSSNNLVITVGSAAQNVNITVYASHTSSSSARTMYLATATTATDISKVIDSKTIGGGNLSTSNLHTLTATNAAAGTYYVFTNDTTMHVYAVKVTYSVDYDAAGNQSEKFIYKGDSLSTITEAFTDSKNWADTDGSNNIVILGKSSGGSKVGSSTTSITLPGESSATSVTKYLDTQGGLGHSSGTFSACVKLTLTKACKITYYATSSGDATDRYIVLRNASNSTVYNDSGTDKLVAKGATITSYSITVTAEMISATTDGAFYLGTKSSGCYIYAIVIECD